MLIPFIIWTMIAIVFFIIGIIAWRKKKEIGFFTGVNPNKMKDVKAYNHAVAKMWFCFSIGFELAGIPFLYMEQNSPVALLIVLAVFAMVLAMIITYFMVEEKYRK